MRPWDIAALKVLVEEAGGRFTDFDGGPRFLETGHAAATNSLLHRHVLRALAPAARGAGQPTRAGKLQRAVERLRASRFARWPAFGISSSVLSLIPACRASASRAA